MQPQFTVHNPTPSVTKKHDVFAKRHALVVKVDFPAPGAPVIPIRKVFFSFVFFKRLVANPNHVSTHARTDQKFGQTPGW